MFDLNAGYFQPDFVAEHALQYERQAKGLDRVDAFFSRQWRRFFYTRKTLNQNFFCEALKKIRNDEQVVPFDELKARLNRTLLSSRPVEFFMILQHLANQVLEDVSDVVLWQAYLIYNGHAVNNRDDTSGVAQGLAAVGFALLGRPVHLVYADTASMQADRKRLSPYFNMLDLEIGCVDADMALTRRRSQYQADICFCRAQELVFDFLRDRLQLGEMKQPLRLQAEVLYRDRSRAQTLVLRGLHVALIADIDKVLVDGARAPVEITASQADDEAEKLTLARLSLPGFFRRYGQLAGYGYLSGLESEFWEVYQLAVVNVKNKNRVSLAKQSQFYFSTQAEKKWPAILAEVQQCYDRGQPLWLSVETQTAAEQIQSMLEQIRLPCEINRGVSSQQAEQTPITLLLGENEVVIPQNGKLIFIEYPSPRRYQHRCMQLQAGGSIRGSSSNILVFVALDDKLLNEIAHVHGGLKLLLGLSYYLLNSDSSIGNFLAHRVVSLADKSSERLQTKIRRSLLQQEIRKGNMLSFSGRGE